jgi:peptide/nickel transport system permease protein
VSSESSQVLADMTPPPVFPDVLGETGELETSAVRERVATAIGVLAGLIFLYFSLRVNDSVLEGDTLVHLLTHDVLPPSLDWIWVWVTSLGLVASLYAVYLADPLRRRNGDTPGLALSFAGLAVSAVLVALLVLDYFNSATALFGMEGDLVWPEGKPTYFFPVSVLGLTLALVSMIQVRGGNVFDRTVSVVLACVPFVLISMPFIMDFSGKDLARWLPVLMGLSGIAFIFCGAKLHSHLSRATLEEMEYYTSRVYIFVLAFLGIVAWILFDAGEELTRSMDIFWMHLLFANVGISALMMAAMVRTRLDVETLTALLASCAALVMSAGLLILFLLEIPDVVTFSRRISLFPLSMIGVSLLMVTIAIKSVGTLIDKLVSMIAGAAPTFLLTVLVLMSFADNADLTEVPAMLSGGYALAVFVGFALLVFVSGLKVETFMKAQWPVVREKLKLLGIRSRRVAKDMLKNPMGLIGAIILVFFTVIAIFGPSLAPYRVDATQPGIFEPYLPSSSSHLMGTDVFGHDIFSSLLYGARTSIVVGMFAAIIASVVGAAVGLYSGYVGGWKDEVLMRINDVMLSIPWLVLMILIAGLIGEISLTAIILIIGLTGWSATARLVRAQVLSLRERQYIERARAIGSGDMHIIRTHILPNSFPLVFANTILTVAISILSEATLSFLHMRPYGTVTWGTMLSYAYECSAFQLGLHYWIVMPGLCIVFLVLGFTLLGYAMDEVLNPRLRKR